MLQDVRRASELLKASRCAAAAVVLVNDSSFALSKYAGDAGAYTDTGYVQYEDSVELAAPRAWVSVRSELTFETGNPAVVGTYVP